jgi:hypothetical protein
VPVPVLAGLRWVSWPTCRWVTWCRFPALAGGGGGALYADPDRYVRRGPQNCAPAFPEMSDGPLMTCVTVGAGAIDGVTQLGRVRIVTDHPWRRIPAPGYRCDSDRRLLPPIPTSRGFGTLNSRRQPWLQLRGRPTVMSGGGAAALPSPVYLGQPEAAAGYSDPPHLGSRRRPPACGGR